MAVLLLLTYVGQSLAASGVPCLMMNSAADDAVVVMGDHMPAEMAAMAHAGHHMESGVQADAGSNSCCDGGLCSMSHCQSVAALPQAAVSGGLAFAAILPDAADIPFPNPASVALYRPPISR